MQSPNPISHAQGEVSSQTNEQTHIPLLRGLGLTHLIVGIIEVAHYHGQNICGHGVTEENLVLLAVHGNVGYLLHQLGTHRWLCKAIIIL